MSKNIFGFRREFITCSDEFADANGIRIRDITVKHKIGFHTNERARIDFLPSRRVENI